MHNVPAPLAARQAGYADRSNKTIVNAPTTRVALCATTSGPCAEVESSSAGPLLAFGAGAIVGGLVVYVITRP